ncbi:CLAVATA3/ESR (CLE)-related protein [Trema orientale]|uniref:CLAVATA3/ESR (CLE)-related protein n=1 Tax=Trema orientale TaxID=63057 RepID=A0A2P5E7Z8_TREOI|nr:CLAVATA3/ESR (CLE)-related protein [Trema orientale]
MVSEARLLQVRSPAVPMHIKNIDSQRLLNELGFDHIKLEHYRRSAILVPDRRSPGGPDPQHH